MIDAKLANLISSTIEQRNILRVIEGVLYDIYNSIEIEANFGNNKLIIDYHKNHNKSHWLLNRKITNIIFTHLKSNHYNVALYENKFGGLSIEIRW